MKAQVVRRGEAQFVAAEVGLREDPKVLGIARRLKVSRNEAVGIVVAWRQFVLLKGSFDGVVRGYTTAEVAAYVDERRSPAVVIDALRDAGMLATKRGGVIACPHWLATATGEYSQRKAAERDRKAQWREEQRRKEGGGATQTVPSPGRDTDGTGTSAGRDGDGTNRDQGRNEGPPGAPEGGEREGADAVFDWFWGLYPKRRNPLKVRRILAGLDPREMAQLRYALPIHAGRYSQRKKSGGWRFVPFADSYLADAIYWEFEAPKPKAEAQPPTEVQAAADALAAKAQEENEERLKAFWRKRAEIRSRLLAAGVYRHEINQRIDDELGPDVERLGSGGIK